MVPRVSEPSTYLERPTHPRRNISALSKHSAVSFSPSNEADDERSVSSSSIMGSSQELEYPGEDRRPTSQRELAGFYAYSFAAEVSIRQVPWRILLS